MSFSSSFPSELSFQYLYIGKRSASGGLVSLVRHDNCPLKNTPAFEFPASAFLGSLREVYEGVRVFSEYMYIFVFTGKDTLYYSYIIRGTMEQFIL